MSSLKIIASLLFLPILVFAQYTGGNGDGFTVWTSQADISLPVELFSHQEVITATGIQLKWETASELENLGFIIKRKTNDQLFEPISSYLNNNDLQGIGNSASGKSYQFTDMRVTSNNSYSYQILSVNIAGSQEIVFQTDKILFNASDIAEVPDGFEVLRNYPNPFNPRTKIVFKSVKDVQVKISIFNILGERIAVLADRVFAAGKQEVEFAPGVNISSQVFICQVEGAGMIKYFKMTFAK